MIAKTLFIFRIFRITGFILTAFLLSTCTVNAQSNDSMLNQLSHKWEHAKTYTLSLAAQMPAEDYDYRPVADIMTFKQQLLHITDNILWLSTAYLGENSEIKKIDTNHLTKEDLLEYVDAVYDYALHIHQHFLPQYLDDTVPFFAGPLTKRQIFFYCMITSRITWGNLSYT